MPVSKMSGCPVFFFKSSSAFCTASLLLVHTTRLGVMKERVIMSWRKFAESPPKMGGMCVCAVPAMVAIRTKAVIMSFFMW